MKKYIYIVFVIGLGLLTIACGKKDKKEEIEDKSLEVEEVKEKTNLTTYVESEKVAQDVKRTVTEIITEKNYSNYSVEEEKALVDKSDEKKIIEIKLVMKIDNDNKGEVEKIVNESAELIEKKIKEKYSYKKLDLYWETPNNKGKDMLELMYMN